MQFIFAHIYFENSCNTDEFLKIFHHRRLKKNQYVSKKDKTTANCIIDAGYDDTRKKDTFRRLYVFSGIIVTLN